MSLPDFDILNFSYDWNHKLSCTAFTTIRLDQAKYAVGSYWAIHLNGKQRRNNLFMIRERKTFLLEEITNYMAYIDTGYDAAKCREIIMTMYKNSHLNWKNQRLCMPLIVETHYSLDPQQAKLFS